MKYCEKCMIDIQGTETLCPLCQGKLTGTGEEDYFPYIKPAKKNLQLLTRWITLICVVLGILSITVNIMLEGDAWSVFVVLALACIWLIANLAIRKRHKIIKNIGWQAVLVSLLCVVWDWVIGWRGWSVDFIIPILCIAAMITVGIIAKAKRLPDSDYIFCILSYIVLGMIPLIFILANVVKIIYPSLICVASSLISLVFLLVFEKRVILDEINRRFHI